MDFTVAIRKSIIHEIRYGIWQLVANMRKLYNSSYRCKLLQNIICGKSRDVEEAESSLEGEHFTPLS